MPTLEEEQKILTLEDFAKILTPSEINALGAGKRLSFNINKASYHPTPRQRELAIELAHYIRDAYFAWHHVPVIGKFHLQREQEEVIGGFEITDILGKDAEKCKASAERPERLTEDRLYVTTAKTRNMNITDSLPQNFKPVISFYTSSDTTYIPRHLKSSWSIHCLRNSQVD